jgi:hypothetical protein
MITFLHGTFVYVILGAQKGRSMPLRTLKLRLKKLIDQDKNYKDLPVERIAEHLGLASTTTANKYLRNEALKFEVRVLEKACDWLNVDIGQLLELVECDFFPHGDKLLRLCSKQDDPGDYTSLGSLHELFDQVLLEPVFTQNPFELAKYVYEQDCVILGSPHNNSAGEIAMCTLFSADPADTSEENRCKLPLLIEAPTKWQQPSALIKTTAEKTGRIPWRCSVMVPNSGEKSDNGSFGEKSSRATGDFYPANDFQQAEFGGAGDFGVILVADHWVGSDRKVPVRTYWLSGFSNAGTQASLAVLQNDIRSFNLDTPQDKPGEFVLGIIQATSQKKKGGRNRILNDGYEIVHTIRGSLPRDVQLPVDRGQNLHPDEKFLRPGPGTPSSSPNRQRQRRGKGTSQ